MKNLAIATRMATRLWDALLLKRPEAVVLGYAPGQQSAVARLYDAAMARLALTDETSDSKYAAAAVALHRETVRLLVAAVLLSRDASLQGASRDLGLNVGKLEELTRSEGLPAMPAGCLEALTMLDTPDLLSFDRLSPRQAAAYRGEVEALIGWLRRQVEPRSLREIWVTRVARLALASLIVLGLVGWALGTLLAPKNLALNKPVTLSSQFPGSPTPEGATDGRIVSPFQACTAIEADPWMMVDLGSVTKISKVVIHNRTDGHSADTVPLTLEFSNTGQDFRTVDYRNKAFTGSNPWVFTTKSGSARYVRIHGHPNGYVVVTEIKVYGR
jgi:hypothetical protein